MEFSPVLNIGMSSGLTSGYFNSHELRAQVSFSDQLLPVICLFICIKEIKENPHQNHFANFNQTLCKAYISEGDSGLLKLNGDNNEIEKIL